MRAFRAALLAVLLMLVPASAAHAASTYGTYPNCTNGAQPMLAEADDGGPGTGEVITTGYCLPMLGTVTGSPGLDVVTNTTGVTGTLSATRWGTTSAVKASVAPKLATPITNHVDSLPFSTTLVGASGWDEIRVTSNIAESDGHRAFTTSRTCVSNNGGTGAGTCGGPTVKGRCSPGGSWYGTSTAALDGGYIVPLVDCRTWPRATKTGAWTITVDFQEGSRGVVQLDGATIYDGAGGSRNILVPAATAGKHALRIMSYGTVTSIPGTFGGGGVITYTAG